LKKKSTASISKTPPGGKESERFQGSGEGHLSRKGKSRTKTKSGKKRIFSESSPPSVEDLSDNDVHIDLHEKQVNGSGHKASHARKSFAKDGLGMTRPSSCVGDTGSQQGCASGGRNFLVGYLQSPQRQKIPLFTIASSLLSRPLFVNIDS